MVLVPGLLICIVIRDIDGEVAVEIFFHQIEFIVSLLPEIFLEKFLFLRQHRTVDLIGGKL